MKLNKVTRFCVWEFIKFICSRHWLNSLGVGLIINPERCEAKEALQLWLTQRHQSCWLWGFSCRGYQVLTRPAVTLSLPKEQSRLWIQKLIFPSVSSDVSKCLSLPTFTVFLFHFLFWSPSQSSPGISFTQLSNTNLSFPRHCHWYNCGIFLFSVNTSVNNIWPKL